MLTNNARRIIIANMNGGVQAPKLVAISGEEVAAANSNAVGFAQLFTTASIGKKSYSDLVAYTSATAYSVFIFGTGTTAPSKNDYTLANMIEQNFSIASVSFANTSNGSLGGIVTITMTLSYSGAEAVTLTEIGLVSKITAATTTDSVELFARDLLPAPITVEPGDTFTATMTFGG